MGSGGEFSIEAQGHSGHGGFPPCPLFVNLEDQPVVVVGGGEVAYRKIESLLSYGAAVTVVAPDACAGVRDLWHAGALKYEQRPYRHGDVSSARYVVCATDDVEVNRAVHDEACASNALVNVVDVPQLCNAIVPAVVRRGKLQVAVSTSGASPSIARELRLELEELFGDHWADYLDMLAEVRALVKERVGGDASERKPLYEALTSSDLEERYECGERLEAEEVYLAYVAPLLDGGGR